MSKRHEDQLELYCGLGCNTPASGTVVSCLKLVSNLADDPTDSMMLLACKKFSSEDIAEFLSEIELSQYAESFKVEKISGEVLLEASQDMLFELGVSDSFHQMEIVQKFRRKLKGKLQGGYSLYLRIIRTVKKKRIPSSS